MRAGWLLVGVCACGRLGFDGTTPLPDAAIDAPSVLADICAPSTLYDTTGQLNGTEVALAIRAAPFAGGYALGIGTDALDLYALHLNANLTPTESSPHLPLAGSYTLWSAVATPTYAFFFVGDTDGTAYLKRLESNFDSYTAIQQVGLFPSDPALAPLGAEYLLGAIDQSGNLGLFTVDDTGATGTITVAYNPPATAVSVAPFAGGVEVAIAATPCEVFSVDVTGATANHTTFATSCTAPYVSPDGAVVVYESAGNVYRFDIATATTTQLGAGSAPRIAGTAGNRWVTWLTAQNTIAIVADNALATATTLSATSLDLATAPTGLEAIWLDGASVHRGTVCTR